jgi:hypothetical protein
MPTATAAANAVAEWPEGNDADAGTSPTGSMPLSGGRARSTVSFRIVTSRPAAPTAASAASAARGHRRRQRASPAAPTATRTGHFTHHADASTNRSVSGSQRMLWPSSETA